MRLVQGLLVAIPSVSGGRVFVNTVLQTRVGKKKVPKPRNLSNPTKNPRGFWIFRIRVGFVGNWLLKTLFKPLASVEREETRFGSAGG